MNSTLYWKQPPPTAPQPALPFYKGSSAVKVFLKVTSWMFVLSGPAVGPQGEAWVTAARNLRPDVCIKSKCHLTCHIPFQNDLGGFGDLRLLYIVHTMFVCARRGGGLKVAGGWWCETSGSFGRRCQSSLLQFQFSTPPVATSHPPKHPSTPPETGRLCFHGCSTHTVCKVRR